MENTALKGGKTFNGRNSGIELLKVAAIFLIILFHFDQTLTNTGKDALPYLIDPGELAGSRPGIAYALTVFRGFGSLGNYLFLICSVWFLMDSDKKYGRKSCLLLTDVWFVSVIILAAVALSGTVKISGRMLIQNLFPSTFSNNWYVTQYVLFLAVLPYLNHAVASLSQRKHLAAVLFLLAAKLIVDPVIERVGGKALDTMLLCNWVVFYLFVSYMKKYLPEFAESTGKNAALLIAAVCLLYLGPAAMEISAREWPSFITIFSGYWLDGSLKCELISIALFNIFRKINIRSNFINRVSKLSLLIYIIHENVLLRTYLRIPVLKWVYDNIGYDHIAGILIALAGVTFVLSALLALLYENTVGRLSKKIGDRVYTAGVSAGGKIIDRLIKVR